MVGARFVASICKASLFFTRPKEAKPFASDPSTAFSSASVAGLAPAVVSVSPLPSSATVVAPSVEVFLAAGAGLARVGQREIAGRAGLDRCVDRENCVNSNLLGSNGGGRVSM